MYAEMFDCNALILLTERSTKKSALHAVGKKFRCINFDVACVLTDVDGRMVPSFIDKTVWFCFFFLFHHILEKMFVAYFVFFSLCVCFFLLPSNIFAENSLNGVCLSAIRGSFYIFFYFSCCSMSTMRIHSFPIGVRVHTCGEATSIYVYRYRLGRDECWQSYVDADGCA